jgi:predicted Zn-dependent protease
MHRTNMKRYQNNFWKYSKATTLVLAGLAPLVGLHAGCGTMGTKAETIAATQLIPPEQENQLGLQVKQELETKQNIRYVTDATVVSYVRGVADRVIAFGKKDRPEVTWQVNVIDDPKTVNAFATPGGYLYVYTGLLLQTDNEAELAGVMAHETGHVVARHSARNMVATYGLQAVSQMVVGQNPSLLENIASGIATKGLLLKHSRSDETEADEYGARYASAAGYDPHGLVTFFQRLQAKEGQVPGALVFLSDHPATPDRVSHVSAYITQQSLGGSDLGAERFAPIKAMVARGVASAPASAVAPPPPPPGSPGAAAAKPAPPPPPPPPPPR